MDEDDADVEGPQDGDVEEDVGEVVVRDDGAVDALPRGHAAQIRQCVRYLGIDDKRDLGAAVGLEIRGDARTVPDADALIAAGKAVDDAGLDKELSELVKLRASQLNGCSFCLQYHLNIARRSGVGQAKLDQLAAWRDGGEEPLREIAAPVQLPGAAR